MKATLKVKEIKALALAQMCKVFRMDKKGTEDDSEVNLTSDAETDTDQEDEVLPFLYYFINLKHIYQK